MSQALALECSADRRAKVCLDAADLAVVIDQGDNETPSLHVQAMIDLAQAEPGWCAKVRRRFWQHLGDSLWKAGDREGATTRFIKGMIEDLLSQGLDGYAGDGIHLFFHLQVTGEARAKLYEATRLWLSKQGHVDGADLDKLLWPFLMADEAGTRPLEPDALAGLFKRVLDRTFASRSTS